MPRRLLIVLCCVLIAACSGGVEVGSATTTTPDAPTGPPAGTSGGTPPPGETVRVVTVFDGDSILVETVTGEREVRLAGINAPETDECFGAEAEQWMVERAGEEVTLVTIPDEDDEDQFGRLLRDVWAGEVWLNRAAAAEGYAMTLHTGRFGEEELVVAGDAAWEDRLGMWAVDACGPAPEGVVVTEFVFDPPGPDDDVPNDEYVVIENITGEPVDVSGWVLRDESSQHRYRFEDGAVLQPGVPVTVRSGCGDSTPTDRHWCADGPVWSNQGDTVLLQTAGGTVVARVPYTGE